MKKTNYGSQYDIAPIDDIRELRTRRALDKCGVARTPSNPVTAPRTPSTLPRVVLSLILGHLVAIYLYLKKF